MAIRKDVLMTQVVSAFAKGCDGTEIGDDAANWFHDRYYDWITTPKENPDAQGRTPQEVWAEHGRTFMDKFLEIGRRAAASGPVTEASLTTAATSVETESECPYCPLKA
jgi:hypothetical protein